MPDLGFSLLLELAGGTEAEIEFGLPGLWAIGSEESAQTIIEQDSECRHLIPPLLTSAAELATKSFAKDRSTGGFMPIRYWESFAVASSEFVLNQTQHCFMQAERGLEVMKEGFAIARYAAGR